MSAWKNSLVVLIVIYLAVTFLIFLVTGYTALYWAWTRGNLGRLKRVGFVNEMDSLDGSLRSWTLQKL